MRRLTAAAVPQTLYDLCVLARRSRAREQEIAWAVLGKTSGREQILNISRTCTILFTDLDRMLDQVRPQAVVIFTDTFDHLRVVEACAARGIPVMMEKPLAVSLEHARAIERAARSGRIPVMVNYETTWYASNRAAWDLVKAQKALGDIRKIVVHDGHRMHVVWQNVVLC